MSKDGTTFRHDIIPMIPALRAFAFRFVNNEADASDLVQETLLKVLAHEHEVQPGTSLHSWL